jgi:hypothetical protein
MGIPCVCGNRDSIGGDSMDMRGNPNTWWTTPRLVWFECYSSNSSPIKTKNTVLVDSERISIQDIKEDKTLNDET